MEDHVSIKEFSLAMGIHVNTAYRMINSGRINAVKLSPSDRGRWRIPQSEFRRMGEFRLNKLIEKAVNDRFLETFGDFFPDNFSDSL